MQVASCRRGLRKLGRSFAGGVGLELVGFVCSLLICLRATCQYTCPLSLLYSLEQGYTKQLQQLELSLNGNGDYEMQLRARSLEVRSP